MLHTQALIAAILLATLAAQLGLYGRLEAEDADARKRTLNDP